MGSRYGHGVLDEALDYDGGFRALGRIDYDGSDSIGDKRRWGSRRRCACRDSDCDGQGLG
jgi:hypothetical protein